MREIRITWQHPAADPYAAFEQTRGRADTSHGAEGLRFLTSVRGEPGPKLPIKLPSHEILVAVRELDERLLAELCSRDTAAAMRTPTRPTSVPGP
jgi:hypothetical protein